MEPTLLFLLIVVLRVLDVSLGTLRTVCIVKGRRLWATLLGFVVSLTWVFVITKITKNLDEPIYMFAFALGFALGNYIGLSLEKHLSLGEQVLRVFSRKSENMLSALRESGFKTTRFSGDGRVGPVDLLLLKLSRRKVLQAIEIVKQHDEEAFYFIDDIVDTDEPRSRFFLPNTFRTLILRK